MVRSSRDVGLPGPIQQPSTQNMKRSVITFLGQQPTKMLGQCEPTQWVGWVTQVTHTKCAITSI
jgi:hypothetical protein